MSDLLILFGLAALALALTLSVGYSVLLWIDRRERRMVERHLKETVFWALGDWRISDHPAGGYLVWRVGEYGKPIISHRAAPLSQAIRDCFERDWLGSTQSDPILRG